MTELLEIGLIKNLLYLLILISGLCIGSFLNVLIFRIPLKQEFVKTSSHCLTCGHKLSWYENIPLFSYIFLRGRCKHCKTKLSLQYPMVELFNGLLWLGIFLLKGFNYDSITICLLASILLALSVIDWKTFEIPFGFQIVITVLAIVRLFVINAYLIDYIIGAFAASVPLFLIFFFSKGKAIGGGDYKLMFTCGLFVGWKLIILALGIGCIVGSIVHIIRMKCFKAGKVLAMGPYLSIGVMSSILFGEQIIGWYLSII